MAAEADLSELLALLSQDPEPGTVAFQRLTDLVEARYPFDDTPAP